MNRYLTSSQLKQNARQQLFGNVGTVIGAFLVHMLCTVPIDYMLSSIGLNTPIRVTVFLISSIIVDCFISTFLTGADFMALNLACRQEVGVMDIFYGFKGLIMKTALVRVIPVTVATVVSIPMIMVANSITKEIPSNEAFMEMLKRNDINELYAFAEKMTPLYTLFFGVFAMFLVVSVLSDIIFSQTIFLMLDYPEKTPAEILKLGLKVMKGNWGRYFYIMLSFIPWYLLAGLTCYISLAYSEPYKRLTYANFYLDLMKKYQQDNE